MNHDEIALPSLPGLFVTHVDINSGDDMVSLSFSLKIGLPGGGTHATPTAHIMMSVASAESVARAILAHVQQHHRVAGLPNGGRTS